MSTLGEIQRPIAENIRYYEAFIADNLSSKNPFVSTICDYILSNRGKQMRPLLVLLSAALHTEPVRRSYLGAFLVEMIHTASLVHDDVVDEAYVRRGKPSVNALWRSRTAVLVGDYILAKSYNICLKDGGQDMFEESSRALYELSEGELIQTEQSETLAMTREVYFDIIYKKTGSLIAASSAIGALSVGCSEEEVERMRDFGRNLGIAFQIKDDLLDFASAETTGKASCSDLRERKITLPLLHVLESASEGERKRLVGLIADVRHRPENVDLLVEEVQKGGGIQHAEACMKEYQNRALALLEPYPDSEIKRSLQLFAEFVLSRKK